MQGTRVATDELDKIKVKLMRLRNSSVSINMNGYWELNHSSYQGGIEERDYYEIKNIFSLINSMNTSISVESKKKKK